MHTCQNCHEPVTAQFARVFGDNEGRVFGCPQCNDAGPAGPRETERSPMA
jgi:protein-arginine kinase activator protein McsA